ncbi:WXG100 family type VII secretion target [Enterococcus hirae]|uniref:WXG100 family type VII secretion target n=1 Tax=Enterococcus hirae TaxID=1354 RepID=UPI00136BED9A|nr:WXG100 family type VII secretion target [Enterococcus hirae]NAE18347.1 hypothetical protein [Enterococcus hirae]
MAGLFDASTTTMANTSHKVTGEVEAMKSDLTALVNRLMALQGQWIGDGSVAFEGAKARYSEANRKLQGVLDVIGQLIASNGAQYTRDDDAARSGISSAGSTFTVAGF